MSPLYFVIVDYDELNSLFHPGSIAIVGVSDTLIGSFMINMLLKHGFQGNIYPVNLHGGEVLGIKAYTSVKDIPGIVDYAYLQVPAQASIQVIKDCAAKGIKLAALFTAGFGESELEGGSELEQELVNIARQSGVRLLGPNCMGIYCPSSHLTFSLDFPQESGPVGVLCQSGGNSIHLVQAAAQHGIRFSKVISYGNAVDINEADLLEYFTQDQETKVIIAYIEGVRQGKRFFQALKAATQSKPVIVLKGGQTEAGAATTMSHTGSLAGSKEVWDSLIRQTGAISAHDIDECADMALAFLLMKPPSSRRTAAIGFGGGATVQIADDFYRAGLILPPLPEEVRRELKQFIPVQGNIFRNPVDASGIVWDTTKMAHAIKIIGNWSEIDLLIMYMGLDVGATPLYLTQVLGPLAETIINSAIELGKPVALVTYAIYSAKAHLGILKLQQMCSAAGLPFYTSIQRAANAMDKLIGYYETK